MNGPPPQGIETTDATLPPANRGRSARPASSSRNGVVAPRRHDGLNRERRPIVAARTFPILNESTAPPLSCTAGDDPRDREIFMAAIPPTKTQKLARLKDKTKEAIKRSGHKHVRPDEAADGGEAQDDDDDVRDDDDDDGGESALHHDDAQGAALARQSIDELEVRIRNVRMGVTMGRHVKRVRVLPRRRRDFPHKNEFLIRDENGEVVKDELGAEQVDYLTWLGQVSSMVLLALALLHAINRNGLFAAHSAGACVCDWAMILMCAS